MTQAMTFPTMDLKSIPLVEQSPAAIVRIREVDGFFLNRSYSDDFRLREEVYALLKKAQVRLPSSMFFMLYEAYRPLKRQIEMWNQVQAEMKAQHPHLSPQAFQDLCETFIANPYDGIGSGHQAASAIDITLCAQDGIEYDMGTPMHTFGEKTQTNAEGLSEESCAYRTILKNVLEAEGFVNYPAEWWHFSYGDHQWAWLTKNPVALYAPLDLEDKRVAA